MGFSLGIVGLPNVGKSTLFNTLSTARADVSNYPFCTIDPNVGVVTVPDERLDLVQQITKAPKKVPTVIEFTDIAGLVKGAHKGEGLGNQFLSHVREVEAIAHVVRCFSDESITHVEGAVDPKRDIELIEAELILADLGTIDKKFESVKSAVKSGDKNILKYLHLLEKTKELLVQGKPARELLPSFTHEDQLLLKDLPLLTFKPVLYVANTDESGNPEKFQIIEEIAHRENARAVAISAKVEAEVQELDPAEAREFLTSIGIKESGLKRLIRAGYELLNLITFFTANEKECRAWTLKRGTHAPQAAGKIHTDFEKGFIAAEVIHYNDLAATGNAATAREKGLLRTEGKNYEVQDGDLVLFRFNI